MGMFMFLKCLDLDFLCTVLVCSPSAEPPQAFMTFIIFFIVMYLLHVKSCSAIQQ